MCDIPSLLPATGMPLECVVFKLHSEQNKPLKICAFKMFFVLYYILCDL